VDKLKTRNNTLVEASKSVVVIGSRKIRADSKVDNIEPLYDVSREERKKEASKPLYLVRYE